MGKDYDTGEILSQEYAELPMMITQSTSVEWGKLIKKCIVNGMKKAISGESGVVQNHQQATYAAPFTEDEKWVNFDETTAVVLRKTLALNLAGGFAKAVINGQVHKIHSANYISNFKHIPTKKAIKRANNVYELATADGIAELCIELFDPHKKYANALPCSAFFWQSIAQQPTV